MFIIRSAKLRTKVMECLPCVLLTLLVVFCVRVSGQEEAGDPCRTKAGTSGTCKFLTDCPSALAEIARGRFPRDICGFVGTQSIICCTDGAPDRTPTPAAPTTEATRRTTAARRTTTKPPLASRGKVGVKAAKMCKSYAQYAYEITEDPGLSFFSDGLVKELVCPFEKEELIIGGRKASRKEFPHMAQVGYISGTETSWACGGSLISATFVLTAGHCMSSSEMGTPKIIRAGITNVTDLRDSQTRNVKHLYTHPEYTDYKYNDIGLIEVVSDFELNTFIRPACIFTQKEIPVRNAIASGWGRIGYTGDESKELLKVVLEMFDTPKCNSSYRRDVIQPMSVLPKGIVEELMICAGSSTEFRDTCQGDSGGPLQIYHEETKEIKCMYEIIGVTSFGKSCGLVKNIPGVYTRVSAYVKWIEDTVWPN